MRCDRCQGTGVIPYEVYCRALDLYVHRVCEECNGSGIDHCCRGDRPDASDEVSSKAREENRKPADGEGSRSL